MEEGPGRLPGRYTSLESLHTNNVLVKKRHSNYSLAPTSTPPLPSMPSHHEFHPSRPPRNPARSNIPSTTTIPTLLSSSASSASIASSSQPLAPRKQRSSPITSNPYSKRPSTADSVFAPSFASRASAISAASNLSSPSTAGSRDRDKNKEKVTPWEFQDLIQATERELAVPAHLVDVTLGGIATTSTTTAVGAAVSPDIGVGKKLTGRVEEVTPWEMHDPPSPALSDFSSSSHPNVSGRARSSTNTSYGSNASASTSSSTGKSVGKSPSTSSSSHKSAGSGLITPTPYAMRFSSAQTEMREVRDHTASFSLSPSASASTSTLGSVGSIIHRPQDHPHLPPSSGDIIYGDRHTDVAGPSTGISISPPLPIPTPSLKPAPSMISLKSSLLPPPATTSTKHVPTPLPLRAAASTASVAPSIASAKSTLSTTSMSSKELTSPTSVSGGSASTGTVEDVTPWELYPPPPVLPPPVASPAPPPLPPMPPTPGGKERKRRSSVSMSLEERRKSASGGVAGALSSMGLGLGKIKTRERDKDKDRDKDRERERTGSVTGHAPPLPSSSGMLHQSSQSLLRPEKDREARVATGLTEDVAPWELEDVVPNPRWVVETQDSENAQYVEIVERKKSASGTPTPISLSAGGDDAGASTMRARGSMTLEQMAEVMPWELYPIPVEVGKTVPTTTGVPVEGGMSSEKSSQKNYQTHQQRYEASLQQPPRQSNAVASSSTSAFSEFGLKRRKSAGGTSGKTKNVSEKERDREAIVATSSRELRERSRLSGLVGISSNDVILNGLPSYPSSSTPISPIASSSGHFGTGISSSSSSTTHVNHGSISATSSSALNNPSGIIIGNSNNINSNNGSNNITRLNGRSSPKSTAAHRTMIEGLRASIKAREAQYVVKGVGHIVPGGGRSEGKKHHPYLREVVPYPRSYEREVVDLDIWETQFCMDLCDSVTWHVFETPPTKVLDLGCGSGTWILHCAKNWKDCHFVGLDIVPLHPDLQVVGSPDLASRITWVQHNFLERLPFQDEEFDYVHIKRIALGVPEDKWDFLLDELARVMKPGAALELIEEDLFFPGIKKDTSDDTEATDDASSTTRRNSVSSDQQSADKHSLVSDSGRPATPTSASHTLSGHLPTQPLTPTPDHAQLSRFDMGGEDLAGLSRYASSSSTNLITPHSRSTARPPLTVKTQKGSGQTYSDMTANQSIYGANVGVLGGMGYMASEDPLMALIKEQKMQRAAAAATTPVPSKGPTPSKSRVDPHGRSGAKMVTDPRDHTMLEAIWNGMLEARFVNRTPLSMLTTYMEYHFTDVRTHPPLMYCFPISHPTEYWDSDPDSDSDSDSDEDDEEEPPSTPHQAPSEPDVDEARDAIVPRPHSIKSTQSLQTSSGSDIPSAQQREWSVFDEESPWVDLQRRLEICYPFITLDGSRVWSKFSPHSGATLPNTILKIDIKSLNQHLALRAKEVIASSESMWEWVLERQAAAEKDAAQGVRNRSGSASIETYMVGVPSSSASHSSLDLTQNAILEMTRDDFNHLMNNFHLDMEDKASLGHATQERFNWHVFKSHVTQDRKAFNKACRKYDRWVARKIRRAKRMATNPYRQTINHQSRNSMSASAPGLVLPASELGVPVDYNIIARSSSTPQPSTGDHRPDDVSSIATAVNSRQDIKSSQTQFQTPPALPTFSLSQLPPEQRYSRALRVFVAWKAS